MSSEGHAPAWRLENLSATKRALLEKRLREMRAPAETAGGNPQIPQLDRTGPIPASYSQERMWLNHQISPQSLAYNSQIALHFTGELDVTALELTLQDLVRRHEVFRTELYEAGGEIHQRILPYTGYELPIVDVAEHPGRTLRDFIDEAITTPFQLDRAPLVRWTLVRETSQRATLICTDHHAVTDGWSRRVIFREMMVLYRHHQRRAPGTPLPPPAVQFADFAAYQRRWLQSAEGLRQVQYWRRQLTGCPTVMDLPLDFPRPAQPSYRGGHELMTMVAGSLPRVKELAEKERVTMFMIFLTGFCALLHRHTGAAELCIGTGIANRRLADTDGIVGMLINTVVLRADCSGEPTFLELLRRVRALTLDAYAHQEAPFDKVVEAVSPPRDLSINPLHQVTFNFQNNPMPAVEFPGVTTRLERPLFNGSAKYDLYVAGWPRSTDRLGDWQRDDDSVMLSWEYNADVFAPETIRVLQAQYRCLLQQATAFPETLLSDLALEPDAPPVIVAEAPSGPLLHQLFASQVALRPLATAVICGAETLTYQALDAFSDGIAARLQGLGHGPEDRIGIMAPRGIPLVAGLLGILKSGAAYVPLDASLPTSRLRAMVQSLGLRTILAPPEMAAATEALGAQFQSLEWAGGTALSFAAPAQTDAALAYILFTSGSTGEPRAVAVPHRAVTRLVTDQEFASMTAAETWLLHSALSFDASTLELWAPLLHGGRLVILPGEIPALDEISTAITSQHVSSLWLSAGVFRLMVDERLEALGGLHQILTGGDIVPVEAVRRVLERFPKLRVVNGYGPTENTTFTCCQVIQPADLRRRSIPIGRPLRGTSVWVLDEQRRPVPTGVPGELCTGGLGLAREYCNQPEATQERFIQHPQFGRLYRTGDRCRVLADGRIEFLGRMDDQVKVRGFRVEPAEIECALAQHPAVRAAAVVAREHVPGERRLVAYVAAKAGVPVGELRRFLKGRLPGYMVPAAFVMLDALPMTTGGKVDRRALPAPKRMERDVETALAPARTPLEEVLAGIWADVLKVDVVGVHDDFFLSGGHSLLALQLIHQINAAFRLELPVRLLFTKPTIAGQAQEIERSLAAKEQGGRATYPPLVPLRPGGSKKPFFLVAGGFAGEAELLVYARLARYLDSQRPFYGLRAHGVDDLVEPHATVESMAAEHIAEMQKVQPHGPYLIGGACIGGVVAFEIAQQLRAQGEEIGLLMLLDCNYPSRGRMWRTRLRNLWRNDLLLVLQSCRQGWRAFRTKLTERMRICLAPSPEEKIGLRKESIGKKYLQNMLRYVPRPYPGPVTLLVCEESKMRDPARVWRDVVRGGLDIQRVQGDHFTHLREHAHATAARLDACLEAAGPHHVVAAGRLNEPGKSAEAARQSDVVQRTSPDAATP